MATLDELVELVETTEYLRNAGWTASKAGGTVKFVRDGYARVIASWIGNDEFVITWDYSTANEVPSADWRVLRVERDQVMIEIDMTLNAY